MTEQNTTPADRAVARSVEWFKEIGVTIPDPRPLRWTDNGLVEVAAGEDVDEEDDLIHVDPVNLEELAWAVIADLRDEEWTAPHRWHPCRWKATRRLAGFLYTSGITRSGGSTEWTHGDGPFYHLPRLSDVLPRRGHLRPYILFKPSWWWKCHVRQGFRLRGRHRPEEPFCADICAACLPCPYCGAHRACGPTCETVA